LPQGGILQGRDLAGIQGTNQERCAFNLQMRYSWFRVVSRHYKKLTANLKRN